MPRYRSSIHVPNPVAEAFVFVTDLRNSARWDPRVQSAEKLTEGAVGLGTRFRLVSPLLWWKMELPYEVVELEAPRRAVLAGRTRLLRYRDEITFEGTAEGTRLTYEAGLALRGILALGNPILGLFIRRIGDEALAGIRRALRAEAKRRQAAEGGAASPPADVTPGAIRRIVAMEDRPVLRNLLITRGYHQLSRCLADFLGEENANWCTFATWASKTAGVFIRQEELDRDLRRLLLRKRRIRRAIRRLHDALRQVHRDTLPEEGDDLGPILEITAEVGRFIEAGNREVFAELGALFAEVLAELGGDPEPDPARLDAFLERLRPGESMPDRVARDGDELVCRPQGGQDLLRSAVRCYYAARFEPDRKRKAEAILLGNALGGLHEQTRLQSYIVGALEAPVAEILYSRYQDALVQRLGREILGSAQEVVHRLFTPLGERIQERVRELSTFWMMRMPLPGEVLELGRDVPAPLGGPLFPPLLVRLENAELVRTLGRFGAYPGGPAGALGRLRAALVMLLIRLKLRRPSALGSAAWDWGELEDRMRYICAYFRSRQCQASLFDSPFTSEQTAAILAGEVPAGAL